MRVLAALAMVVVFANASALAQTITDAPPTTAEESDDKVWSMTASAYTYFVPDSGDYVQPTVAADRGWLHLEARYNYEALHAGSAWLGYNFSGGETVAWEFTPMLGGVFGDLTGVAPGYKGSLTWWKIELSSEGEHVFDAGNSSDSFFYNWSELTLAPVEQFRFGVVTQRTRVRESDREIQRGALLGFTYKKLDLSAYWFDPDDDDRTFVLAVGLSF